MLKTLPVLLLLPLLLLCLGQQCQLMLKGNLLLLFVELGQYFLSLPVHLLVKHTLFCNELPAVLLLRILKYALLSPFLIYGLLHGIKTLLSCFLSIKEIVDLVVINCGLVFA